MFEQATIYAHAYLQPWRFLGEELSTESKPQDSGTSARASRAGRSRARHLLEPLGLGDGDHGHHHLAVDEVLVAQLLRS